MSPDKAHPGSSEGDKTLKTFFDSAPLLMGVVEVFDNEIIHVSDNAAAASFFGHEAAFMQGKSATELGVPAAITAEWIKHYKKSQETKGPIKFNYWHETPEGSRHFSAIVSFIEMVGNHPRFSYIVQDTTLTSLTQKKLHRQETFLETILDNIPDMIFVKEASELRFLLFNKAGEELIGCSKDELIGKNDYDLFPPEQAKHFTSKDREVFKQKKMVEIPQEPIQTKKKGERILHTKKIPLFNAEGEPLYLVGISEDITDQLQTEGIKNKMFQEQVARQEAEKSLQERDEFISIASHELKSPLSALKLQAQMFRRKISKGEPDAYAHEKVDQLIDLTEMQVQRLNRLVNDMLDVSRIRSGKLSIEASELNLYELTRDVLERMKEQFLAAGYEVPQLISSTKEIHGHWDQMRVEQVLDNLLTNAIRYGLGRPVQIELSQQNGYGRICVRDQGFGIAAEHVKKIFDRFERAIDRNEVSGLGLGLFISKQIAEAHGGRIWVESEAGKGASFYLELPLN